MLRRLTEGATRLDDGRSPWRSALPYVRRYLVRHAADGHELDPLLCDAGLVLAVDAEQLFLALPSVRSREGRRAELALRSVEDRLRGGVEPKDEPKARAWLRLAAVCTGADRLAQTCDVVPQGMGDPPWRARWAAWGPGERGRRYEGLPAWRGVVLADERPGGEFIGALRWSDSSAWSESSVVLWDLDSGEAGVLKRAVSGLTQWNPWRPVPQLGRAAAVLNQDKAFAGDFSLLAPRARKNLASVALLHYWSPDSHGRTTWRLLPEPLGGAAGPDARVEDVAAAEQFAVSGVAGKPTFVALNAPFGIVLFSLTDLAAFDGGRRAMRRLSKDEREDLRRRRADLLGLPLRRLPLRESRVTWLCAPGGLPGGQFLFGYADGAVLHHDASSGVTTPVETGHEARITGVTVLARTARPPLVIAAAADGSVRAVELPVTPAGAMSPRPAEPSRLLLQAGSEVCSVAVRAHGRDQLLAAVTRDGELYRVDALSGRALGRPRQVGFHESAAVLTTLTLDDEPVVAVQGGGRGLQLYEMLSGRRVGGQEPVGPARSVAAHPDALWVGTDAGVVRELGGDHPADLSTRIAHQGAVVGLGALRGPRGMPVVVSAGADGLVSCWDPVTRQELWHTEVPGPPPGFEPTLRVADFRQSSSDRAALACGYGGGLVHVLLLRGGIPAGEQRFRVPGPVTAVTLGRACGREVVVATGAGSRMHCWDLDAGRWWGAAGMASTAGAPWIDSVAVHADGSGRCFALDGSGQLHSLALPSGRPLRPAQRIGAEGGRICLVAHGHRTWLVAVLGRAVSIRDAERVEEPPQFRLNAGREVTALRALPDGTVLCGDRSGEALLLRFDPDDGWRLRAAADQPEAATALAGAADLLAVGATRYEIHVRGVADGHLRGRLSPRCDAGVAELAVVREGQVSTGSNPRLSVVGRSDSGLVERWDLSGSPIGADPTDELLMPAGHGVDAPARFVVFPGKAAGGDRLLSVSGGAYGPDVHEPGAHEPDGPDPRHLGGAYALFPDWPARRRRSVLQRWHRRLAGDQSYRDHFPRRHSVWSRQPDQVSAVWAVRAGGRGVLLAWRGPEWEIDLFDLESHKLLPTRMVFAEPEWEAPALVAALDTPDGPELAVVAGWNLHLYDWEQVSWARRPGRTLEPVRVQELPFAARLGAVVEGGRRVAVANGQRLAVLRLDGAETVDLRLPSICTALTPAGDRGVAVGTRNGVVVIDGPQTWL